MDEETNAIYMNDVSIALRSEVESIERVELRVLRHSTQECKQQCQYLRNDNASRMNFVQRGLGL